MHLNVIDEDHAAFFAAHVLKKWFRNRSEQIHDWRTDADEIESEGGGGHEAGEKERSERGAGAFQV